MLDSNTPLCPRCNKPMQLRNSYRGPFWGCVNYPSCREIIAYDSSPSSEQESFPRKFQARPKGNNKQSKFYECISLPEEVIEYFYYEEVNNSILRSLAQWRVDYSIPSAVILPPELEAIIRVMEKILTRGRISLCSESIEEFLKDKLNYKNHPPEKLQNLILEASLMKRLSSDYSNFSKTEEWEKLFFKYLISKIGDKLAPFITHQPFISYLVHRNKSEKYIDQRADFLITNPEGRNYIVEIDGDQHQEQTLPDQERDKDLKEAGFEVVRIPAHEVSLKKGQHLDDLLNNLKLETKQLSKGRESKLTAIELAKIIHQIQICLLLGLQNGHLQIEDGALWNILIKLPQAENINPDLSLQITDLSLKEFLSLFENIQVLYSESKINVSYKLFSKIDVKDVTDNVFIIDFNGILSLAGERTYSVQDIYLPFTLTANRSKASHFPVRNLSKETTLKILKLIFGRQKKDFWEGQWDGIERILQQKDLLILMPTGSGKTIMFQLASFLMPGMAIVIDPLISLIIDQVENLRLYGIDSAFYITSTLDYEERIKSLDLLATGEFLFYYVSPERFQRLNFQTKLKELARNICINIAVIDEVHCVSEWGHDFRPSYIALSSSIRECCRTTEYVPPIIGLTGTASANTIRDIKRELQIVDKEAVITLQNFDRKELEFIIKKVAAEEKRSFVKETYKLLPTFFNQKREEYLNEPRETKKCGLIFFPFRQGQHVDLTIEQARDYLEVEDYYCGDKPRFFTGGPYEWIRFKREITIKFKNSTAQTLLCTKAFGMGIDKPNIRSTIHICCPLSPESYYQEAGRAGRSREKSFCFVIYSKDNEENWNIFTNGRLSFDALKLEMSRLKREGKLTDDLSYIWYFHNDKFKGAEEEHQFLMNVVSKFGELKSFNQRIIKIPMPNRDKEDIKLQIALNRLKILGIIDKYGIDRNQYYIFVNSINREMIQERFKQYLSYNEQGKRKDISERLESDIFNSDYSFLASITKELILFIYETIETGRRAALKEIVEALRNPDNFRNRIINYLTPDARNEEDIENVIKDFENIWVLALEILKRLRGPQDAESFRGQVARRIAEDQPFNPGLRLLRGLIEFFCRDTNMQFVTENIELACNYAKERYKVDLSINIDSIVSLFEKLINDTRSSPQLLQLLAYLIYYLIENSFNRREAARRFLFHLPLRLKIVPLKVLIGDIMANIDKDLL